uniref:Uncharacterized protein n=1 Tax=Rhizophora mucronata TaxID=61149 RepID=A0A2P2KYW4_RHIMU
MYSFFSICCSASLNVLLFVSVASLPQSGAGLFIAVPTTNS